MKVEKSHVIKVINSCKMLCQLRVAAKYAQLSGHDCSSELILRSVKLRQRAGDRVVFNERMNSRLNRLVLGEDTATLNV